MHAQSTFEILTDSGAASPNWEGALIRLLRVCRELVTSMNVDIRAGLLPRRFCARSNVVKHAALHAVREDLQALMEAYPLDLQSPFEGVPTIFGGIWKASALCEDKATDALLKLRFLAGTMDLPMHCHEHSDRVILVAEGAGIFDVASDGQSTDRVISTEVAAGDALVFARGTVHTFKVPSRDLVLLSYHSPFIALDDTRQYTVFRDA